MAPHGSVQKPKNNNVKANAFDAFLSDEDSDPASDISAKLPMTPSTATPPASLCGDLPAELEEEGSSILEWTAAPTKRKARSMRPPAENLVASGRCKQNNATESLEVIDADAEWLLRKGQRHSHTTSQKSEWNFKAKQRTAYAKEKRASQRTSM
mmetsp:Transcript_67924/g.106144  ORF Transcript_67924/g.106144 Transcript_67924/m.106144 type:complete len:154 (+) Transcript_67924:79-540(+)|eukprot:CAMPEP_0169137618 /NCGR_PEP_ID=MMETSP1015-20121227/41649_1 /TAXON_ID=342587 /ORGANISM="Karlodinium micrum, Strain CCMP2283" /LENGTH=153 /DNA_ID=CAMNT_0009202503 /DNA_START=74 /DNA_END=535 /DNA_ORIENTATION=-